MYKYSHCHQEFWIQVGNGHEYHEQDVDLHNLEGCRGVLEVSC